MVGSPCWVAVSDMPSACGSRSAGTSGGTLIAPPELATVRSGVVRGCGRTRRPRARDPALRLRHDRRPSRGDPAMSIDTVALGIQGLHVSRQGLGCMGMSQSYGAGDDDES